MILSTFPLRAAFPEAQSCISPKRGGSTKSVITEGLAQHFTKTEKNPSLSRTGTTEEPAFSFTLHILHQDD